MPDETQRHSTAILMTGESCRESIGPLVDPGGNLVSDEAGMATMLNNHFASVFTVENTDELSRLDAAQADAADHADATLDTVQFTPAIVEEKLGDLGVYKLVGTDNMHPRVLKELKGCLSASLADIFTRSMATAEVPDEWKIANVTGIYKKGGREIGGNYRPISLTSVVCKTMERIIRDTLVDYLEHHQLMVSVNVEAVWPTSWSFSARSTKNTMSAKPWIWYTSISRKRLTRCHMSDSCSKWHRWEPEAISSTGFVPGFPDVDSVYALVRHAPSGCQSLQAYHKVVCWDHVKDIDIGITSRISKFADDTKLCKLSCDYNFKRI